MTKKYKILTVCNTGSCSRENIVTLTNIQLQTLIISDYNKGIPFALKVCEGCGFSEHDIRYIKEGFNYHNDSGKQTGHFIY